MFFWIILVIAMLYAFTEPVVGTLIVVGLVAIKWGPGWVREYKKNRYFESEEFLAQKAAVQNLVAEHNELEAYVHEIQRRGTLDLGRSSTGQMSHLAQGVNTSVHNYRRDRHVADLSSTHVHNCSLQVVRNAEADPLKYLMKYFGVRADEETLAQVEDLSDTIERMEQALANVRQRESEIAGTINPPAFMMKYFAREFMEEIGVQLPSINPPYPTYKFQYVSAGGNSGQETRIQLNGPMVDALIIDLAQKIKWRKSAAGQRALMTSKLRNQIKVRDNHTCQSCSISVYKEPHLLLEIDHIIPVSRGGLSVEENLQTLCWKCNRSKSNKIPA